MCKVLRQQTNSYFNVFCINGVLSDRFDTSWWTEYLYNVADSNIGSEAFFM